MPIDRKGPLSPARPRGEAELASVLDAIAGRWRVCSQREIARKLGLELGAVSGLVMRARRNGDKRFPRRPNPVPKPKAKPPRRRERPPPEPSKPPEPSEPRLLVDLGWKDCRWPVGATADGRHLFCGRLAVGRGPYCQRHCEKAPSSSSTSPHVPARFAEAPR
jgi:hypothetical protein